MHTIECKNCGHHMEGTDEAAVVVELQWHLECAHEPAELVTFTYKSPEYVEVGEFGTEDPHPDVTTWLLERGYADPYAWMVDSDYTYKSTHTGWCDEYGNAVDPLNQVLGAMEAEAALPAASWDSEVAAATFGGR